MNEPSIGEMIFYLDSAKKTLHLGDTPGDRWFPAIRAALLDHEDVVAERDELRGLVSGMEQELGDKKWAVNERDLKLHALAQVIKAIEDVDEKHLSSDMNVSRMYLDTRNILHKAFDYQAKKKAEEVK